MPRASKPIILASLASFMFETLVGGNRGYLLDLGHLLEGSNLYKLKEELIRYKAFI